MTQEIYFIDVPFDKKEAAKAGGARWNPDQACWFVTEKDHTLLSVFKTLSDDDLFARNTKVFIDVPYELREVAKKGKARWDPAVRSWYVMGLNHPLIGKFPLTDH